MLNADDKREIKCFIYDRMKTFRDTVARNIKRVEESGGKKGHLLDRDLDVVAHATFTAATRFSIHEPEDVLVIKQLATDAAAMPWTPCALLVYEMFRLSREDLLDIAHWAERTDGYSASYVQVSAFIRSVIRGNLKMLHEERVPPEPVKKLTIKRRKA